MGLHWWIKGFVYFVQCPANGLIKIGITGDHPDKRLGELRKGSPFPLEPLGVLRGARKLEAAIHFRFWRSRSHGEWFRPTEELLGFICEHARPWPRPNPMWHQEEHDGREDWFQKEFEKMADWALREREFQRFVDINKCDSGNIMGLA